MVHILREVQISANIIDEIQISNAIPLFVDALLFQENVYLDLSEESFSN